MTASAVYVTRSESTVPGTESWLDVGGDSVLVLSAWGVSEAGSVALGDCCQWFVDHGHWLSASTGGAALGPVSVQYLAADERAAVRLQVTPEVIVVSVSERHFTAASAEALAVALDDCLAAGWRRPVQV